MQDYKRDCKGNKTNGINKHKKAISRSRKDYIIKKYFLTIKKILTGNS